MSPPSPPLLLLTLLLLFLLNPTSLSQRRPRPRRPSPLSLSHYSKSCPKFDQILQDTTTNKQISSPTTAAASLRLLFHDCFVGGCDASVLVSSSRLHPPAERDADVNLSLPGDGFDVVVRAKSALELSCPGVVSCADILAVAARNLLVMTGGPFYPVPLGRKDSLTSRAADVANNIPLPNMSMDVMIVLFKSKGFSVQEMVALSGAHTIGFSHCKEFSSILYDYNGSGSNRSDPAYYSEFAKSLRNACAGYGTDPTLSVFNDVITPNKFDNVYYGNVRKGLGLLRSDHLLSSDPRTRGYVELYSRDQDAFFKAFAAAMEKLSVYGVKTGRGGEIRRRCDAFNN